MTDKIDVILVKNPFEKEDKEVHELEYKDGFTLLDVKENLIPATIDAEFSVSINGRVVNKDELALEKVKPNDSIVIMPYVGAPLIPIVIAAASVVGGAAIATAIELTGGTMAFAVVSAIAASAIAIGLNMVAQKFVYSKQGGDSLSAISPGGVSAYDRLEGPQDNGGINKTQLYSWNPHTTQQQGLPISRCYGTHIMYGNIISVHTTVGVIQDGTWGAHRQIQTLNILLHLGLGPYKSISGFKINNQAYSTFSGITYESRLGLLNQSVIANFNDTKTEYSVGVTMNVNSYTYTTISTTVEGLEVDLSFPNGLFYINDQGNIETTTRSVLIEYSIKDADSWTTIFSGTISGSGFYQSALLKTYTVNDLSSNQYDVRVSTTEREKYNTKYADTMVFYKVREIITADFEYPRQALVGVKAIATDQLSGSLNLSCVVEGSYVRKYSGSTWDVVHTSNPAWVCYDILTQPVLSGSTITAGVDAFTVERYEGVAPKRLDEDSFKDWADFCNGLVDDGVGGTERRCTYNGVIDSEMTVWEAALQVCRVGRAALVWSGTKISIAIDQAGSPVQLFSVANINKGSFKELFLPEEDLVSEIQVNFTNKEKDYEKDTFTVINESILTTSNKISENYYGITKQSEARRAAMFTLYQNQLIRRTVSFDANVDAIACTVGDIINIQHDIPQWGFGGRLVDHSGSGTTVQLDQEVVIDLSKTYEVQIRISGTTSDILSTRIVSGYSGSSTVLLMTSAFPSGVTKNGIYVFGEQNILVKPFRVIELIKSQSDMSMSITGVEYNASVYSVDTDTAYTQTINYSTLVNIAPVTDLQALENISVNQDGTLARNIYVHFTLPITGTYSYSDVYYQYSYIQGDPTATAAYEYGWQYGGRTYNENIVLPNALANVTYTIKVVSVSIDGTRLADASAPTITVTTTETPSGSSGTLLKISGLEIYGQGNSNTYAGNDCRFVWDDLSATFSLYNAGEEPQGAGHIIPNNLFKDYEVRIYNINGTLRRGPDYVQTNNYIYTYEMNEADDLTNGPDREYEIRVRARNIYYVSSETWAHLKVNNPAPATIENLTTAAYFGAIEITCDAVVDNDLRGYIFYASQDPDFEANSTSQIYKGKNNYYFYQVPIAGTYYVKGAAYDAFGVDSLNLSDSSSIAINDFALGIKCTRLVAGTGEEVAVVDGSNSTYRFYAGSMSAATAPFSVTQNGEIYAESGTIANWSLTTNGISDGINEDNAKILIDKTNTRIRVGTSASNLNVDGENVKIVSSNYSSGALGSGFHLSSNLLEIGNIACRGIFRTAVFQKTNISAIGGNLAILPADVVSGAMTAADSSPLITENNVTFSVNDIVRMKEGSDDEWMRVTADNGSGNYTVTRDLAGSYAANSNPSWTTGACVVNYQQSGDGFLYMTASDTNAPYLQVSSHKGSPWSATTTYVRLGNLNGFLGYSSDIYGIAIGGTTAYLKYDPTNGLQIKGEITVTGGDAFSKTDDTLDDIDNGVTYGRTQLAILDSGYLYLMRKASGTSRQMLITSDGVAGYANNVKNFEIGNGVAYLGDQSNEHIKLSSAGLEIKDGASLYATYGSGTTIGLAASEHIYISSGAIRLQDGASVLTELKSGIVNLGDQANEHVKVSTAGTQIYDGASLYATYGSGTTIGLVASEHIYISSGSIRLKDGSTVLTNFSGGSVQIGRSGTTYPNILISPNNMIIRSGTSPIITISSSGVAAIDINNGGSIFVNQGGDITLADGATPGEFKFINNADSTKYWTMYKETGGDDTFFIVPSVPLQADNPLISMKSNGYLFRKLDNGLVVYIDNSGNLQAVEHNNLGDAAYYWGDVSYKTLTDRGCLGWFDGGVEMQDGSLLSDLDAIKSIKKHPTKKTVYGVPMLDYKSMPKSVYKQADKNVDGNKILLPRDEKDEPYSFNLDGEKIKAEDGAEMTAMFSIVLGAIKELNLKIENLEKRIKKQ